MAYQRGVFGSGGSWGALQDFTMEMDGENDPVNDASGNVEVIDYFNKTAAVTFDVVFTVGSTLPTYGATFTVAGAAANNGVYYCEGVSETQNNKTHTRASVRGRRFLSNGVPTA